jgi:hypothetical protein
MTSCDKLLIPGSPWSVPFETEAVANDLIHNFGACGVLMTAPSKPWLTVASGKAKVSANAPVGKHTFKYWNKDSLISDNLKPVFVINIVNNY